MLSDKYEKRNNVKDNNGNYYKIEYKNKYPNGYGSDIFAYISKDNSSWSEAGRIFTSGFLLYEAWGHSLSISKDNILCFTCVASEQGNMQGGVKVYFSKSLNGGSSWSGLTAVSDGVKAGRADPMAVSYNDNVYAVWVEKGNNFNRTGGIYFSGSSDNGDSWSQDMRLGEGEDACIKVDEDGIIYIVYTDSSKKNIVFFSYSKDGGSRWHTEATDELPVLVYEPYVIIDPVKIIIIFNALEPSISGLLMAGSDMNYKKYYFDSKNMGKEWSEIKLLQEDKN